MHPEVLSRFSSSPHARSKDLTCAQRFSHVSPLRHTLVHERENSGFQATSPLPNLAKSVSRLPSLFLTRVRLLFIRQPSHPSNAHQPTHTECTNSSPLGLTDLPERRDCGGREVFIEVDPEKKLRQVWTGLMTPDTG